MSSARLARINASNSPVRSCRATASALGELPLDSSASFLAALRFRFLLGSGFGCSSKKERHARMTPIREVGPSLPDAARPRFMHSPIGHRWRHSDECRRFS